MSSKIKVLQVIPKLGYGGAETGCYDLAHYLAENSFGSYLVTYGGELTKYIDKKKVKLIRLPVHSKNPILILINTIILIFVILFADIKIVHARSRAPAWSCFLATKITGRKFVTTFHGTYNFKNKIKKYYNSIMVRSDLIIAGSNFIFNHIKENYSDYLNPHKKFLVIFRGINTEYFNKNKITESDQEKLIADWGIDKSKPLILLPGRLTSWKGQEVFIEALKLVNEKIASHNLNHVETDNIFFNAVILGSDQGRKVYKKKLTRLVQQHRLNHQVKLIDECKLMPLAYKISDLIISASTEPEAFGRVAVEAQSMEKVIIASNIGGSNETIINEKTGFLFESGNAEDLSKKIIYALNLEPSRLNSMGIEGRKNIEKKFNVEKMCFSTYSEYKKLFN
jgi:glycosyltransferase involved in cell wall biosynthesis